MRKFLLSAVLAFIFLPAFSQLQWWDSTPDEQGLSLSVQAGFNMSKFMHVERWSSIPLGFQFGPSVTFGDRLSAGLIFDTSLLNISEMGGKVGNFTTMIKFGYKFATV